jgi:hypothetical protein
LPSRARAQPPTPVRGSGIRGCPRVRQDRAERHECQTPGDLVALLISAAHEMLDPSAVLRERLVERDCRPAIGRLSAAPPCSSRASIAIGGRVDLARGRRSPPAPTEERSRCRTQRRPAVPSPNPDGYLAASAILLAMELDCSASSRPPYHQSLLHSLLDTTGDLRGWIARTSARTSQAEGGRPCRKRFVNTS